MLKNNLFIDIESTSINQNDIKRITHPSVSGVILFTRNFINSVQLKQLIKDVRSLKNNLIIGVDHEGGRVQRFRESFYPLPPMSMLGDIYNNDPSLANNLAKNSGWVIAKELGLYDIDLNFSPVLDINYGNSSVIGNRSFDSKAEVVVELASSFIEGLNYGGMAAVGKHFPGHGYIKADSHLEISTDYRSLEQIEDDLFCFDSLIKNGIQAIMPSHVIYEQIDKNPSSMSPFWIKKVLKTKLGFKGFIISDDLSMKGVANLYPDIKNRCEHSVLAGCDLILICNNPDQVDKLLSQVNKVNSFIDFSPLRLKKEMNDLKTYQGFSLEDMYQNFKKHNFSLEV